MAEKKKTSDELPIDTLTKEEIETNKKKLEDAKKILTPPEGQVLAGLRAFCPVHGDITRASKIIKHTIFMKNEETGKVEPVTSSDVVCLACLSDLWRNKVVANYPKNADGTPGEIRVSPVFIPQEEYEKLKKESEEKEDDSSSAEDSSKEEIKTEVKK